VALISWAGAGVRVPVLGPPPRIPSDVAAATRVCAPLKGSWSAESTPGRASPFQSVDSSVRCNRRRCCTWFDRPETREHTAFPRSTMRDCRCSSPRPWHSRSFRRRLLDPRRPLLPPPCRRRSSRRNHPDPSLRRRRLCPLFRRRRCLLPCLPTHRGPPSLLPGPHRSTDRPRRPSHRLRRCRTKAQPPRGRSTTRSCDE
jgi:hypothetical protein